jgi:hypothetical protein
MKRSGVTHHRTAWCRNHRATSRWSAGSVRRRRSGRGGKRVAGATSVARSAPLAPRHPDQDAIGPHHRQRRPVAPTPPPALVVIPAQLPCGLFMARLDGVPPMGIARQLFQGRRGGQVAPRVLALFWLAACYPLPLPPATVSCPLGRRPPTPHGDQFLPPPPLGPLPPPDRSPLPAGQGLRPPISSRRRGRRLPLETDPSGANRRRCRIHRASARHFAPQPRAYLQTGPCSLSS